MRDLPQGWFPADDIEAYRKLVAAVPVGGHMVELGCWLGRSLCSLADIIIERNIRVNVVDTFKGNPGFEKDFDIGNRDPLEEFNENCRQFGILPTVFIGTTDSAVATLPPEALFDLVFIDADHSYEYVKRDIESWKPHVRPGGVLAGDDFGYPDVRRAVSELLPDAKTEASIWVTNV